MKRSSQRERVFIGLRILVFLAGSGFVVFSLREASGAERTLPVIKKPLEATDPPDPVKAGSELQKKLEDILDGDVIPVKADAVAGSLKIESRAVTLAGPAKPFGEQPSYVLTANIEVSNGATLTLRNLRLKSAGLKLDGQDETIILVQSGGTLEMYACVLDGPPDGSPPRPEQFAVEVLGTAKIEACRFFRFKEGVRFGEGSQSALVQWCYFDTCYWPIMVNKRQCDIKNNLIVDTGIGFKDPQYLSAAIDVDAGSYTVNIMHNTSYNPVDTGGSAIRCRGGGTHRVVVMGNLFVRGRADGIFYADSVTARDVFLNDYNDIYGFRGGAYGPDCNPADHSVNKLEGELQRGVWPDFNFSKDPPEKGPNGYSDSNFQLLTSSVCITHRAEDGGEIGRFGPTRANLRANYGSADFGELDFLAKHWSPPEQLDMTLAFAWTSPTLCPDYAQGTPTSFEYNLDSKNWLSGTAPLKLEKDPYDPDGKRDIDDGPHVLAIRAKRGVFEGQPSYFVFGKYRLSNSPAISKAEATSSSSIGVDLTATENPADTEYYVSCKDKGGNQVASSGWKAWTELLDVQGHEQPEQRSWTFDGLDVNSEYEPCVKARNIMSKERELSVLESDPNCCTKLYTWAKAPYGLEAKDVTEYSITVTWSNYPAPEEPNPDWTDYIPTIDGNEKETVADPTLPTEYKFGSEEAPLDPNTNYVIVIKAQNEDATHKTESDPLPVYTHANPPKRIADTQPTVELLPDSKMRVCWDANGNPDVTTHYTVTVKKRVSEAEAQVVYFSEDLVSVCWDDIDLFLDGDHEYEIWIQAENKEGVMSEPERVAKYGPLRVEMGVGSLIWTTMPPSDPGYKLKDFRFWLDIDFSRNIQKWVSEPQYPEQKQVDGFYMYEVAPDTDKDRMGFFKVQLAPQSTP